MTAAPQFLLLGLSALIALTGAHVRLTFPPARYPSLDFLDSARSNPPCGVPKPDPNTGKFTSLKSGSVFNVTWFQSYAHKGGFRIELLNDKDSVLQVLSPDKPQYVQLNDDTIETYQVQLPDQFQCDSCAIRLLRQATDLGEFQFFSCADVSITKNPHETCSGNGRLSGDNCICDRLYSGPECQYKDECWEDKDCGLNGVCQEPYGSSSYPRRVCYCKLGYFGSQCNKTSILRKKQFDPDLYNLKTVGSDWNKIYWRILDESSEIEVVLQYPTTSWVALGWRPNGLDNQCQAKIFQKFTKSPELEPTAAVTAETTVHGGTEPDIHAHIHTEPETSPSATSHSAVPEPTTANLTSNATVGVVLSTPLTTVAVPIGIQTKANRTSSAATTVKIVRPTTTAAESAENGTEVESETTKGRTKSGGLSVVHPNGVTRPNIPSVVGTQVVLVEAPQVDIVTQKPKTPEVATTPDLTNFDFNGKPVSPIVGNHSKPSDVSYVEGESCFGEWRWPPDCMDTKFPPPGHKTCDYRISWSLSEDSDDIEWSIETRGPTNWWTGLGFSKTGSMTDADMIIVTSESGGEIKVRDGYSTGYAAPAYDADQNVKFQGGTHVNGVLRVGFTRPRKTGDFAHDVQFSDSDCFYLLFPVTGGRVTNGQISQHLDTPKNSSVPVCIRHCSNKLPAPPKTCVTEHKYPPGCTVPDCDYRAKWHYNPTSEDVTFEITAKEMGRWTGIGFSRDGNMTNSDMVIGWMYEEIAYVTDRFAYGKHQPAIDSVQNIAGVSGKAVNGYQTISFRRKLVTDDKKEDLALNECLYFLYPIGGGRVLARTSQEFSDKTTAIGYHDLYIPHVSKEPICICTDGDVGNSSRVRRQATAAAPTITLPTANLIKSEHSGYMWETSQNFSVIRNLSHVAELINHQLQATLNNGTLPPVPEPELPPTPVGTGKPQNATQPIPEGEPNPQGEPKPGDKSSSAEPHSERPKNALTSPMDCTDIVVGSAIGDMSRIGDFYTVSRATPRQDSFYGGEDSLTAAVGWEENGVTTLMFRKPLKATDSSDHSIADGYMQVIWAKGQETRNLFYPSDVLKYHGRNRGALQINFMDKGKAGGSAASLCQKQFSYPANCESPQCTYSATWYKNNSDINFSLTAKVKPNSYTGIGWSTKGAMANADIIIVKVNANNEVEITDRFSKGYGVPENDREQDIFNIRSHYADGLVSATFTRPITTADTSQDVNLDSCQYFLYIHTPGPIGSDGQIGKHSETPVKSVEPICMTKCDTPVKPTKEKPIAESAVGPAAEDTPKPSSYYIQVYMPDAKWSDDLKDPSSQAYQTFTKQLLDELTRKVSPKLVGFKQFKVIEYIGSVYARLELVADGHSSQEIQQVLQQQLSQESGGLKIDPQTIQVSKVHDRSSTDLTRNYIIIGVCCGVVLISILFGVVLCIIMRNKRSRSLKMNGSYAQYPSSGYQQFTLPSGMSPEKTGSPGGDSSPGQTATTAAGERGEGFGYTSEVYHNAKVGTTNSHSRQYSSATTATVANGKKGAKGQTAPDSTKGAEGKETSLNEWYQRVGQSDESPSEQKNFVPPPLPPTPFAYGGRPEGAFVAYPNDPYGYYTAQNRMYAARGAVPPTNFYRPY